MPSTIVEALRDIEGALSGLGLRWYLFGAQAAIIHGAARVTADLDVTVALGERTAAELVERVTSCGFLLRVAEDDAEFIEQSRVLPVVHEVTSLPVDLVLAGPGLEELFFERVELIELENQWFPVASAEDMVVMKILAGRARDLEDAEAIVAAQGARLDFAHVEDLLRTLEQALDQSDLLPLLERLRRRVGID
jgi:hypothetical protein